MTKFPLPGHYIFSSLPSLSWPCLK